MPLRGKAKCYKCETTESLIWHNDGKNVKCNECLENELLAAKIAEEDEKTPVPSEKTKTPAKRVTRTTRSYKTRQNPNALPKQSAPKGKGRRNLFKKHAVTKLQPARSIITTRNHLYHQGQSFRLGDVVAVQDVEGGIFYAMIRGLMIDQYCEKSAALTWLLPTQTKSPFAKKGFDPLTFVMGPHDELPRKLDCLQYIMSSPVDYFRKMNPFPLAVPDLFAAGYIWGRLKASGTL